MRGLVSLQQLFVDGDCVVNAGGKGILGREAVEHGHNFDSCVAGDGNGFRVGTGIGVEAAAVQVDEDLVEIRVRHGIWRYDVYRNTGDFVLDDLVGAEFAPGDARGIITGLVVGGAVNERLDRSLIG